MQQFLPTLIIMFKFVTWFNKSLFALKFCEWPPFFVASLEPGGNNPVQHTEQCDKALYRHYTYMRQRWRGGGCFSHREGSREDLGLSRDT